MTIERIACVGAGLIGASWAALFAAHGFAVCLEDVNERALANAIDQAHAHVRFLLRNHLVPPSDVDDVMDRVRATRSLADAVADADYVQESVFERYDVKREVFQDMDALSPERAILASSASALLMSEIQTATSNPGRCVIAHPWNPAHLIPLVEIVPGAATSTATVDATYRLMETIGKIPIVVKKEVPGYVANRLQAALVREALDLVDQGVASVADVDKAVWAGPGMRWAIMGPFTTMHLGHERGIASFLDALGESYGLRWRDMATWMSIPASAAEKAVEGVRSLDEVRARTIPELASQRDAKLIEILKLHKR
jgi:3-hydroxypropionate dehydrogenase (NADP+)